MIDFILFLAVLATRSVAWFICAWFATCLLWIVVCLVTGEQFRQRR